MQKTFNITLDDTVPVNPKNSFEIWRGDQVVFNFTFLSNGEALETTGATLQIYAKVVGANGIVNKSELPLFAGQFTSPNTTATFDSDQTAGDAGNYLMAVQLVGSDGSLITAQGIYFELKENGYAGIYQPSEDFRDQVLDALSQAQAAATQAQQSATSATESATSAKADAESAKQSSESANSSSQAAINSAENAGISASSASNSATAAQQSANAAQTAAEHAQQISDPNNIIGSLQVSKANTGMLYFTGRPYGTNDLMSVGELFSVAYRTDFQFDYSSAPNNEYRPWSIGQPSGTNNICLIGMADGLVRVLYGGGQGFRGFIGSKITAVVKPINDVIVVVSNPTGGNMDAVLYVNGTQIGKHSMQWERASIAMTGYRLNAYNYAASLIDTTMKDFAIFNFDMSAEGAPYSVADYSAGKPVPPSALAQTAVLLENYTFTVGSTQYIPDVSGNNNDATITGNGTVAGTFDKAIAKLASLITSTNA